MHNAPISSSPNTDSAHATHPNAPGLVDSSQAAQLHFAEVPLSPANHVLDLSTLRLQKNLTLDAAASALRLSQAQINALELQNWAALPAAAYVKGFLRNYTRLLGVAAEPYIAQYDAFLQQKSTLPASNSVSPAPAQTTTPSVTHPATYSTAYSAAAPNTQAPLQLHSDPTALASHGSAHQAKSHQTLYGLIGLLIAATALFILFWERAAWLPALTQSAAPVIQWANAQLTHTTQAEPAPSPTPSPSPAPTPATSLAAASTLTTPTAILASANGASTNVPAGAGASLGAARTVQFEINKSVWIEVRDSGNAVIYTGTKPAGTKDRVTGTAPLSMVIGAADAVTMTVDGSAFDLAAQATANVARFKVQ